MVLIKQSKETLDSVSFDVDDVFDRKPFWIWLSNLISNSENESLVISVNAPRWEWKSHFLKMRKKYLEEEKSLWVIYFNSFKNDFIEDPFLPLLWEIIKFYNWNTPVSSKIKEKWKNILKWLLPLAWKITARCLMWWDIGIVEDKLEELVEWEISSLIWKTLEEYTKKDDALKIFKKTLESVIEKEENKQVVFIIDELDRCRPDFALKLLERIKHFFDIKWLYFVLWINKKQIEEYIQKIYGNIDSKEYLQKFIDIETILPKKTNSSESDRKKYIAKLFSENETIFSEKIEDNKILTTQGIFYEFSEAFDLSLRSIEKSFNYLILFYKSFPKWGLNLTTLVLIIVFLRSIDSSFYKKFKEWKITKQELIDIMKIYTSNNLDDGTKKYMTKHINFIFDETLDPETAKAFAFIERNFAHADLSYETRRNILNDHISILDSFNI